MRGSGLRPRAALLEVGSPLTMYQIGLAKGAIGLPLRPKLTKGVDLPMRCATRWKQTSRKQMEEIVENRQEFLTLRISSEGREHLTAIVSLFAHSSCVAS